MEAMTKMPDKAFELAIVDPPYGIGAGKAQQGKWISSRMEKKEWDKAIPSPEYFNELLRVSKEQIIFGGNYFNLRPSRCFIVWDKGAGFLGRDFAECEIAWCSRDGNAKIFKYDPLSNGDYHNKIHPTQKPVALYKWLLQDYAKQGDKILDTHGGSGSICIACHDLGFDLDWMELDKDYYDAAVKRFEKHKLQPDMFQAKKEEIIQENLI
jgi:site-specific DNA-methyltransferase (adenine-specific)